MSRKILVTGGAGFIGSKIAAKLLELGHAVTIIDNLSTGYRRNLPAQADFKELDLSSPESINNLSFVGYDGVFHLAAQSSGARSFHDPVMDMKINALSTAALLQKSLEGKVRHFLYASSMGAYGDQKKQPVSEAASCRPISFYGCNKEASENYCRVYQSLGLETTCFRMFNVYGPGQNLENMDQGMVSIYLAYLLKGEKITIKGSLSRFRDFVYVDDVVDAWIGAFENPNCFGKIYNLGSGKKTTVQQLVHALFKEFSGRKCQKDDFEVLEGMTGDQFGMVADIKRISKDLNWIPKMNLQKGIGRMVQWAKQFVIA